METVHKVGHNTRKMGCNTQRIDHEAVTTEKISPSVRDRKTHSHTLLNMYCQWVSAIAAIILPDSMTVKTNSTNDKAPK